MLTIYLYGNIGYSLFFFLALNVGMFKKYMKNSIMRIVSTNKKRTCNLHHIFEVK